MSSDVSSPRGLAIKETIPLGRVRRVMAQTMRDSVQRGGGGRAGSGKLNYADIEGGTFTVSNLGMFGVDGGFPLPRPPEGAILLVGRVQPRPVVENGSVVVRDLAWFSLTYDHRFVDGAAAAKFLQDLQEVLLKPERL